MVFRRDFKQKTGLQTCYLFGGLKLPHNVRKSRRGGNAVHQQVDGRLHLRKHPIRKHSQNDTEHQQRAAGRRHFFGGVVGAFVMLMLEEILSGYTIHWQLYLAFILLGVVLLLPNGLGSLLQRKNRGSHA